MSLNLEKDELKEIIADAINKAEHISEKADEEKANARNEEKIVNIPEEAKATNHEEMATVEVSILFTHTVFE